MRARPFHYRGAWLWICSAARCGDELVIPSAAEHALRTLPGKSVCTIVVGMDLHLDNPDLQAKLNRWVAETGRSPHELVEDAMAGYFDELARTCEMLNSRYDDLQSGTVKPIDGEAFLKIFVAARRNYSRSLLLNDCRTGLRPSSSCGPQDITEIWEYLAAEEPLAARRVREQSIHKMPYR